MSDPAERATSSGPGSSKADDEASERERSTIEFPYMGLDDAIAVSKAIHQHTGSGICQHDQLAAALKLSMNSSGFRTRLTTARMFGLIESDRGGGVKLTDLGNRIVDGQREREARAKAFLNVPLYRAMYELYRGKVLPPSAAAIEREMSNLGVAQKQTDRARQAFERSAQAAGFFESGRDRLVAPGITDPPPVDKEDRKKSGGGEGPPDQPLHPFIQGLLQTLPQPETEWPAAARAKWLQTAANIFDLIYKGDGGIEVKAATAGRSPRPSD